MDELKKLEVLKEHDVLKEAKHQEQAGQGD